jgi:hypothetical protein
VETWVVVVEAAAQGPGPVVDPLDVESLLSLFGEQHQPLGHYAPDRFAIQVSKAAERAELAMADVIAAWRRAAAVIGLDRWEVVRAEVMTPTEMEAEVQAARRGGEPPTVAERLSVLEAVNRATRELMRVESPEQAAQVVVRLVHRLGGSIVLADGAHPYRIPLDLSFGTGRRISPAAVPHTRARSLLEEFLPDVVADGWRLLAVREPVRSAGAARVVHQVADVEVLAARALEPNHRPGP